MDITKILRNYKYFFQFDDLKIPHLIFKFIFFIPLLLIYTIFAVVGSSLYYVFIILMTPAIMAYTSFRKQSKINGLLIRILIQIMLAIFGILFTPFLLVGLIAGLLSMLIELILLVLVRMLVTKEIMETAKEEFEEDPFESYTQIFK